MRTIHYRQVGIIGRMTLALLTGALMAGCATVPRQDLTIKESFPARPAQPIAEDAVPIDSQYQVLAQRALAQSTEETPVHYAQLLQTGDDALLARLHLIRAAEESITIQTFLWKDDAVTRVLFDELLQAAQRGVRVRLLVDAYYPMGEPRQIARWTEAHELLQIRIFNPFTEEAAPTGGGVLGALLFRPRGMNRRMHSKSFVVDERIAIIGGRNMEGTYYDRHPTFIFKDRDVVVIGPVAREVAHRFNSFWDHDRTVHPFQFTDVQAEYLQVVNRSLSEPSEQDRRVVGDLLDKADTADLSALRSRLAFHPIASVEFTADGPSRSRYIRRRMTDTYRRMIRQAEESLVFQTPYLIYEPRQRRDLRRARRNAPGDLEVAVSANSLATSDQVRVYAMSYKHRRHMIRKKGMNIYELRPVPGDVHCIVPGYDYVQDLFTEDVPDEGDKSPARIRPTTPRIALHAKTVVKDGQSVLIGSHNFDPRSTRINAECGVIIRDPNFAQLVEADIRRDIHPRNSWVVARTPVPDGFWAKTSRQISAGSSRLPFLDLWPQRYMSSFEPVDMDNIVPPRQPDFVKHYRDIGHFPEVDDPAALRRLRLVKWFGGWARFLM